MYALDDRPSRRVGGERLGLSYSRERLEPVLRAGGIRRIADAGERAIAAAARSAVELEDLEELRALSEAVALVESSRATCVADLDRLAVDGRNAELAAYARRIGNTPRETPRAPARGQTFETRSREGRGEPGIARGRLCGSDADAEKAGEGRAEMVLKAYYSGGRIDVFDTDHHVDAVPQKGNPPRQLHARPLGRRKRRPLAALLLPRGGGCLPGGAWADGPSRGPKARWVELPHCRRRRPGSPQPSDRGWGDYPRASRRRTRGCYCPCMGIRRLEGISLLDSLCPSVPRPRLA